MNENTPAKNTPLTDTHIGLGAKMVPFAGYNMPVYYKGIKDEHLCVRGNVGVFDVSHMGEFIVKGKDALNLIQKVTSNDASKLTVGQAQYSCLPNSEGGIIDDLLVYLLEENGDQKTYLLVVNASNIQKDWDWISQFATDYAVEMTNISEQTGLLAIQGPNAMRVIQALTDVDLSGIPYYHFKTGTVAGIENIIISATGYTGAGGFELYCPDAELPKLWNALFEAGKSIGIAPIGLGARDTLRLEMGYCLYGNDIDDSTSPLEAGLGWITKTKKGDFNSSEIFKQQLAEGVKRKLVAFEVDDRRIARHGHIIEDAEGQAIGVVTSGTSSPSLGKSIGLGYVQKGFDIEGSSLIIALGSDKKLAAKVVKLPFYK